MRMLVSALLVCSLVGCRKKEAAPAKGEESKVITLDTSKPGPAPVAAEAGLDTCAFVSKSDVEKLLGGKLMAEPDKQAAAGSMLGGCSWTTDAGVIGTVSARPAGEYDGTVAMDKDAKDLAGVGEKAKMTKFGAFVQPAGKPYFMQVMVMANGGNDEAKTTELAKLAVAGAK